MIWSVAPGVLGFQKKQRSTSEIPRQHPPTRKTGCFRNRFTTRPIISASRSLYLLQKPRKTTRIPTKLPLARPKITFTRIPTKVLIPLARPKITFHPNSKTRKRTTDRLSHRGRTVDHGVPTEQPGVEERRTRRVGLPGVSPVWHKDKHINTKQKQTQTQKNKNKKKQTLTHTPNKNFEDEKRRWLWAPKRGHFVIQTV